MDRAKTKAEQCALDIQTDDLLAQGIKAILGADHVVFFKDGSTFWDVQGKECLADHVFARHGYARYEFPTAAAAETFRRVNHVLPAAVYVRKTGKFEVLAFDGWESVNGDQMADRPRFIMAHDVTAAVLAANEAEEISDEDLEAAGDF